MWAQGFLVPRKTQRAAANPLSQNKLMEKFGLTRAAAQRVREQALTDANGHHGDDTKEATNPAIA